MNRYQKLAWFNLIIIAATILITALAITIEIRIRGYSTIGFWVFVVLLLPLKLKPYLFKKSEDKVLSDERDSFIVQRATSFAYKSFWFVFFASSLAVHIFKGWGRGSVPAGILPLMAIGGALFIIIVSSISILVQYHRGAQGEQS